MVFVLSKSLGREWVEQVCLTQQKVSLWWEPGVGVACSLTRREPGENAGQGRCGRDVMGPAWRRRAISFP